MTDTFFETFSYLFVCVCVCARASDAGHSEGSGERDWDVEGFAGGHGAATV